MTSAASTRSSRKHRVDHALEADHRLEIDAVLVEPRHPARRIQHAVHRRTLVPVVVGLLVLAGDGENPGREQLLHDGHSSRGSVRGCRRRRSSSSPRRCRTAEAAHAGSGTRRATRVRARSGNRRRSRASSDLRLRASRAHRVDDDILANELRHPGRGRPTGRESRRVHGADRRAVRPHRQGRDRHRLHQGHRPGHGAWTGLGRGLRGREQPQAGPLRPGGDRNRRSDRSRRVSHGRATSASGTRSPASSRRCTNGSAGSTHW